MNVETACGRVIVPTEVVVYNSPLERDNAGNCHDILIECKGVGKGNERFVLMERSIPLPGSWRFRSNEHVDELANVLATARGILRQYGGRWVDEKPTKPIMAEV